MPQFGGFGLSQNTGGGQYISNPAGVGHPMPAGSGTNTGLPGGSGAYGGGGSQGVAQPAASDPQGFAGIANQFGLSSNYRATSAPVDYYDQFGNRRGFGSGGAGEYQTQQGIGKLTNPNTGVQGANGSFNQAGTEYGAGANGARIGADYAQAGQQAGMADVNQGYGAAAGARNAMLQNQNLDSSIRAQMAMSQSGAPAQKGLAAYNAAQTGSQMQLQGGRNAAMAAQDIQAQYDQMYNQNQLANRGMNLQQLGLSQQNAAQAAEDAYRRGALNQQQYLALMGLQQGYAQQTQQGQEAYAQLASGNYNAAQGLNAGVASEQGQAGGKLMAATASAMAGGMGAGG